MGFPHEVLVSKKVVISGTRDGQGEMTTIEGGIDPFGVEAPGTRVTIQRLRFVHPKGNAIEVTAVSGLVIAYCRIEGLEPQPNPAVPGSSHRSGNFGCHYPTRSAAYRRPTRATGECIQDAVDLR